MIQHLPSEIQNHIASFVNDIGLYMTINKDIYKESKQEYFNRIRKQNINYVIDKKRKIHEDNINLNWTFNNVRKRIADPNIPTIFRSKNADFGHDHMFIPIDMFQSYITTYSDDDAVLWEDAIVTIDDHITVGKICYERFV